MTKAEPLAWHVYAPDGELIAAMRYAIHAAGMALTKGTGAKVTHCGRVVLGVEARDTSWEAQDAAAKVMIDLAHRPSLNRRSAETT